MRNIMEQYMEKPEILMLTQQSLQSENFKEMLSKNTETKITIIDTKNPSYHELIPERYFLLVDFSVEIPSETLVYPEFNCEVRHSPISSGQCHFFKDNRW
ncbi:hypothetical protein R8N49_19605, partial [Vibrio sp. 1978]|nr:hypothetical protein [Vibrio sp. 1978]